MAQRRQHIRNTRAVLEAGTPLEAEYPYDQTLKALRVGDGATQGGFLQKRWGYAYPLSPAQITADQNNYNPSDLAIAETLFLTSDAKRSISGLAGGGAGRRLTLVNRGAFDITLLNSSTASLASNRFVLEGDVVLRPNGAVDLQYSAADARWMRADGNQKIAAITEEFLLTGAISPPQIAADQNDYAPTGIALSTTLKLSSDASRDISGLVDPRDGVYKVIINVGSNPIVLRNQDTRSLAANRFDFGADVNLSGNQSATLRYDSASGKWKLLSSTAGAAVASGAVTARTLAPSALQNVGMVNGTIVTSRSGNAETIAIKTLAGVDPSSSDPVHFVFRDVTVGAGDFVVRTVTSALQLTLSSGSAVGLVSSQVGRIWLTAIDNGGTVMLGVINCLSGTNIYPLAGSGLTSTTAEGGAGAADYAEVMYAASAVVAKPYFVVGYLEYGLGSTGAWNAAPARIQLFGPGIPLPGQLVQSRRFSTGSVLVGSTPIPMDDSVPQSNEGDQYMALSITPTSTCNVLDLEAAVQVAHSASPRMIAALFRDAAADALTVAQAVGSPAGGVSAYIPMKHRVLAGGVSATTFKVRAGSDAAGATTLNGVGSSRFFGGAFNSFVAINELMA
jgi:hypothetical protein